MSNLKRFLAAAMAMLMIIGASVAVSAKSFPDVASDARCARAVDILSDIGVIRGGTDGKYHPELNVTREQMAMFIARYESGLPDSFLSSAGVAKPFKDLTDPGYYSAITYAVTKGIINGREANVFDGKANVTYSEAVKMVVTALGYQNVEKITGSNWYIPYLQKARDLGITAGFEGKSPVQAMTRGEVAVLLLNAFEKPMNELKGTRYEKDANGVYIAVPVYKTIAADRFMATTVTGVVEATSNYSVGTAATTTPTKNNANPIRLTGRTEQLDLVNTFGFSADFRAEDLLGREVSYTVINGKILGSLNILGTAKNITSATYDADKKVLSFNNDSLNFNWSDDKIVYVLENSKLVKLADPSALKQVNEGFYLMTAIDNPDAQDMVIYYPLSVAQVGDDLTAAKTVLGGTTVTDAIIFDNAVGAKKGDFVLYFAGSKTVVIHAVAVKSEVLTAQTVYYGNQKAVMSNKAVYEKKADTVANSMGLDFTVDGKYVVYTVANKVVYVTGENASAYRPGKSYSVFENTGLKTINNYTGEPSFPVTLRDANGAPVYFNIAKLDDAAIDAANTKWNTVNNNALGLNGKIVVKEGTNLFTADSDKFYTTKVSGNTAGEIYTQLADGTSIVKANESLYLANTANGSQYFKMVDYSVILAKLTVNGETKYYVYKGSDKIQLPSSLIAKDAQSKGEAIFYGKSSDTVKDLVFMYIEATVASAPAASDSTAGDSYIVVSEVSNSNSVRTYMAQSLKDGSVAEIVTKKDSDGNIATYARGDVVRVISGEIKGSVALVSAAQKLVYANGFLFKDGTPLSTANTIVYTFDAKTGKFIASTDLKGKTENMTGAVIPATSDASAAAYVVVQGEAE